MLFTMTLHQATTPELAALRAARGSAELCDQVAELDALVASIRRSAVGTHQALLYMGRHAAAASVAEAADAVMAALAGWRKAAQP